MTDEAFAARLVGMTQVLYRCCYLQLCTPADREDAVQEALRKAWEKRGRLRDDRLMQTWLIRILINECHNIQRRNHLNIPLADWPDEPSQPHQEEDVLLRMALMSLQEKYRMPLLLHYVEGYPLEDVSRMLLLPMGTVKSRMARGKQQLKQRLSQEVFEA